MLLIETELKESPIEGIGLYTKVDIKKDCLVWEYNPLFDLSFDEKQYNNLPDPAKGFVRRYGYRAIEDGTWHINIDLARHMNHSENPSLYCDEESRYFALYDLTAGTELTCDYCDFAIEGCNDFLLE